MNRPSLSSTTLFDDLCTVRTSFGMYRYFTQTFFAFFCTRIGRGSFSCSFDKNIHRFYNKKENCGSHQDKGNECIKEVPIHKPTSIECKYQTAEVRYFGNGGNKWRQYISHQCGNYSTKGSANDHTNC